MTNLYQRCISGSLDYLRNPSKYTISDKNPDDQGWWTYVDKNCNQADTCAKNRVTGDMTFQGGLKQESKLESRLP